jgi:ribosomal protein S27AE
VATLRWLHVRPEERGRGIATSLVEAARRDFTCPDRSLEARVLEAASEGGGFLERFGLERADSEEVEIGGEQYHELVYTAGLARHDANEPLVEVPVTVAVDGEDRPLAPEEPIPGTTAPFFQLYSDDSREERYGYFCSSCASTAVVADGLDRLECSDCGNHHLAEEWDDAYL